MLSDLEKNIKNNTILISIMYANNEIGTIEPIKEIGKIAKRHNIIFHTDAVQAIGNVEIDVKRDNIDLLSMSGHKFYAPKGIGVLYVKDGITFQKLQDGGHQERDKRAGTENVAGIVGIGKAIELAYDKLEYNIKKQKDLREYLIKQVENKFPMSKINGHRTIRLPGNCSFSFENIDAEEVLYKLDERGICASAGSACSTNNPRPSHVLLAIGLTPDLAKGTLRFTLGDDNTKEDVDYLVKSLEEILVK